MPRLSSIHRIVLGLVCLSVSILMVAGLLGFIPNSVSLEQQSRHSFCESTAVSFMALATRMDSGDLQSTIDQIRTRNPEVLSIGVRQADGQLILQSGDHAGLWTTTGTEVTSECESIVPIHASGEHWGQLEVFWGPSSHVSVLGYSVRPDLMLTLLVAFASFIVFTMYLSKVLKHISPSKVVPTRVREALNALAEGLLVLDRKQTIVLANDSFAAVAGETPESLVGKEPGIFDFKLTDDLAEFPWHTTSQLSVPVKGVLLTRSEGETQRTFSVSTVPVRDNNNESRGVVASFEDVTQLQKKQFELRSALTSLRSSTDEIRKQNRELEWLATRDTLTGCLNRCSFFREYERHWQEAKAAGIPMAGLMVDIDHFKSINDNFGHGMGDEVLRVVSKTVMETVNEGDLVCRYGGEEFTVLMPNTSIDEAELRAERCRIAIKAIQFPKLQVTASLGVSSLCQNPESPQDLLDQADKCLYVAKRNGRNQVVRFDKAQRQIEELAGAEAPTREQEKQSKAASAIPFHAVAALTTAMAHRDQATAVHSRRVADLCVATAEGLLSLRECYILEIGALLHDIGKIGIPDTILRKPGRLSHDEMESVNQYNRMGVDMVRGSFGAPVLTEIVEQHVVYYDMSNADRGAGPDKRPSIAARILNIANSYDTMVSELSYRDKMTRSEAFAELRRCAGTQFDPELVERFINAVNLRHHQHVISDDHVTKESALSIGLLLEQLISALDDQDRTQLSDITESIQIAATTHGLADTAKQAKLLHDTLEKNHDEFEVMQMAGELLDLCRATQSTLLESARSRTEIGAI